MANEAIAGADKLKERILSAARAEVKQIQDAAAAERNVMETAYEKEAVQTQALYDKRQEDTVKAILERSRTNAELQARKDALLARRAVLERVFTEAYEALITKTAAQRGEILMQLLKWEAVGGETVISAKADSAEMQKNCEAYSQSLEKEGKKPLIFSKETADVAYGFILKGAGYEKDCSLQALMRDIRTQEETSVKKILFD